MSPRRSGSWPGSAPARKAPADAASQKPRRTSTLAVISDTSSASASVRTSAEAQGAIVQSPSTMAQRSQPRRTAMCLGAGKKRDTVTSVAARIGVSLLAALALGGVVAPASRQYPSIAPGVRIGNADVGGLTAEPARAAAEQALRTPLRVSADGRTWTVSPASLGARADVETAVMRALQAGPGSHVPVSVRAPAARVRAFVTKISRSVDRKAVDARFVGFASAPVFAPEQTGVA